MKRLFSLRMALILLLLLTAAAASVVGWSNRKPQAANPIRIENKTRALTVESVGDDEKVPKLKINQSRRFLKVTVRNGYDKPVVAYSFRQLDASVAPKSISGVETHGATIGWKVATSEISTVRFSVAAKGEVVLILMAVLLEDGTGDGDGDILDSLKNYRAGVKEAYQQIVLLLRQAAASNKTDKADATLQSLKNGIEAIPQESLLLPGFEAGVHDGKERVTFELKELEDRLLAGREFDYLTGIKKILSQFEEYLAQL